MGWIRFIAVGLLVLVPNAEAKTVLKKKVTVEDESTPTVELEMRPSWTPSQNRFFSFNYGELGYKFSKDYWLGYQQQFSNELQTPAPGASGFALNDGYV